MAAQGVTRIRIKGNLVGIIGLQEVMESMKHDYSRRSDDEIGKEMMRQLAAHNYVPGSARDNYLKAFVREFRMFLGQPVEEEAFGGLEVQILGPGCAQCSRLEMDVRNVMAEMNLPGELTHISDLLEIGRYGVMGTPALVINKKVVSVGSTPERKKIRQWLEAATENQG